LDYQPALGLLRARAFDAFALLRALAWVDLADFRVRACVALALLTLAASTEAVSSPASGFALAMLAFFAVFNALISDFFWMAIFLSLNVV
jgi:hypothetical protein